MLTLERIAEQAVEIAAVRALVPDITILHGIECDIQEDGSLDVPDAVLERLDIVLASMHESYGHSPSRILQRYERVLRHPLVNVITHPANRSPGRQPGYALAFERLFEEAARTGTAVEIDGAPGISTSMPRWRRWPRRRAPRFWSTATATWPIASAGRCGSASAWPDGQRSRRIRCSTRAT